MLHNFARQACPSLVPVLLDQLTKQEEDQELDDCAWTAAMAAGACLSLLAECAGSDVVPLIMPYVQVVNGVCGAVMGVDVLRPILERMKDLMIGIIERLLRMPLERYLMDRTRRTWHRLLFRVWDFFWER